MDLINYQSREKNIIQCVHCNGSGICGHSELILLPHDSEGYHVGWAQVCHTCGQGLIHKGDHNGSWWKPIYTLNTKPKPPLCRICSGKGYTAIV